MKIRPLRFIFGLTLLVVCIGIPVVQMTRIMVQLTGWAETLKGWGWSLLFGVALGLGTWLLLTGLFPLEKSE